jgi:tetratricopeptide (TPR) repeat protein
MGENAAAEDTLLDRLTELLEIGNIDETIEVLKENTGRGKIIDPSDTPKLERLWSGVGNALLKRGELENTRKVYNNMFEILLRLQEQENARYHKGLSLYNIGNVLFRQAFQFFLYSFIEDVINQKKFPEALSVKTLQSIFKVPSEWLQQLSADIFAKMPDARDPIKVLVELNISGVPAELWTLEYAMQEIETKLRKYIESKLSSNPEWWEKQIPQEVRKNVEDKINESSEVLWFSEQPISPMDYLSFPQEYIKIITCDDCWKTFESTFRHKAIIKGKLTGLGQIRHKIAHYRKISERERQMFEETIKWLDDRLKQ